MIGSGDPNYVVSFSGGKDSTALLLMMLERRIPIHAIIFFDTGWEYPAMYQHIQDVETRTGVKIWKLHPVLSFDYWLTARPVKSLRTHLQKITIEKLKERWEATSQFYPLPPMPTRKGDFVSILASKVYRIGNSWPSMSRRWCTRQKVYALDHFCRPVPNVVSCVGYAAGEEHRLKNNHRFPQRYFLQEWGITGVEALEYCRKRGFDFGGLYDHSERASCFCCPFQRIDSLRRLRSDSPDLWARMLRMDSEIPLNRGFKDYTTVHDFDRRFRDEKWARA